MNESFHSSAHAPRPDGTVVDITPESAGWEFSSLLTNSLDSGEEFTFDTGESEWIVLPLAGAFRVRCDDDVFSLQGRSSVFHRVTDFAYVPRDARVTIQPEHGGGRFALTGAKARRVLRARYGPAESVPVELRGAGNASRQCNNFASPEGFETDRLIAVEVLTPGGNWSSYPPHKHDQERMGEAKLEEIYYFEVRGEEEPRGKARGYQRVYSSGVDKQIDVLAEVRTGDTVIVPYGYHGPTMAAPGYDLYFLNVLAGDALPRSMSFCDDPAHAWIRSLWTTQAVDPRLPMTTHRGTT